MNREDLEKLEQTIECVEKVFSICINNLDHEPYFRVRDQVHQMRNNLESLTSRLYNELHQIEMDL